MKKLISILLAVLMLASLATGMTVFAADTSGTLSGTIHWNYDEPTKIMTFSGTGDIPWQRGVEPWKSFREDVETLIIGEGVTGIGAENFAEMKNLKTLTLPSTLEVIGFEAFHGCTSLQDFELPASVSRIDQAAFQGCERLTRMILPDQITVLHGAVFAQCVSLTEVHLPANLKKIYSSPFTGCTALTEIDIPNGVTEIPYGMFYGCTSLKTVHLPRNLKSIGKVAFQESGIEELWVPATVEELYDEGSDGSFYSCTNLKALYFLGDAPEGTINCFKNCAAEVTLYHTAESKGWDDTQLTGTNWNGKQKIVEKAVTYTHTALIDCTGSAAETWTCPETGSTLERSTAGLDHAWTYTLQAAPENGQDGSWERTCAVCGKTETVAIPDLTAEAVPASTYNQGQQTYLTYGSTVKSYLVPQENGGLLRVEALSDGVTAERYDSEDKLLSRKQLPMELPIFGGFYAGNDYNFLVFGQTNLHERDDVEVLRIVRYTKDMLHCGEVSIYGANTYIPFSSGSLRMAEADGTLFLHTCHQMFKNSGGNVDNLNHQANLVISIDVDAMRLNECFSRISGSHTGYISHSFNQFIAIDGEEIYTLNQGDAGTRGAILSHYPMPASSGRFHNWSENIYMFYHNAFPFAKEANGVNNNVNGATLGGFVLSDDCLVIAGSSSREERVSKKDQQNIFLTFTQKNVFNAPKEDVDKYGKITGDYTKTVRLTDFASDSNVQVSTPQLVRIDGGKLLVLWTEGETLKWTFLDGGGEQLTETYSMENGKLSDCVPVVQNGSVVWYVTENGMPAFFRLNLAQPETVVVSKADPCANGHAYQAVVTDPTCTEKGYTTHTCSRCGDSYQDAYVNALGHSYGVWAQTKAPTCTEQGEESRTCSRCGATETRAVDALGHTPGTPVRENNVAPTCTAGGSYDLVTYCSVCHAELERERFAVEAAGHQPGAAVEENRVNPTCTENGGFDTAIYCAVCGAELSRTHTTLDALGHLWDNGVISLSPNCTTAGVRTFTCQRCGKTETEAIAATGHVPGEAVKENEVNAACTTVGGYDMVVRCKVCGVLLSSDHTEIPALGHDYALWTQTTAPTCTEQGEESRTCSRCGATETRAVDALGHTPGEPVKENEVAAACTESGSYDEVVYCTVCGAELSRAHVDVDPLGHDWGEPTYEWAEDNSTVTAARVCKRDASHVETETAVVTSEVTLEATYAAEGEITCTAAFTNPAFAVQTKKIAVPKLVLNNPFTDVTEGEYYYDAVLWAVNADPQVTSGTSDTTFGPKEICTRAQVVTFLWRAKGCPEPAADGSPVQNPFKDVKEGAYYYKAVLWAVENGVTTGTSETTFSPNKGCTRAQVVTFLWRAEGCPEPAADGSAVQNPFNDVKETQYYYKAVLWAVEKSVTTGSSPTTFSPNKPCVRGQIVTFLYRDLAA